MSPPPLHATLTRRLESLPEAEQRDLLAGVRKLSALLGAEEVDAAPMLAPEPELDAESRPRPRSSCPNTMSIGSNPEVEPDTCYRHSTSEDGSRAWRLAADTGVLEVNAPYTYLLFLERFADTCVVVDGDDDLLGFVLGLTPPDDPDVLFVWQVAVADAARGRGIATGMLRWLMAENPHLSVLEATVTPDNEASNRLFRGFARSIGAPHETKPYFDAELFPPEAGDHDAEVLHRIGPLSSPLTHPG